MIKRRVVTTAVSATLLVSAGLPLAVAPAYAAENGKPITCQTPPKGSNANALATALVTRFFTLIKNQDNAGMSKFIDKAWLSQTSDGTSRDSRTFIGDMPTIENFAIANVAARLNGFLLNARYQSKVAGNIAGKPYSSTFAPRLATFSYCSGAWKMLSQANFDPLIRDPKSAN